MMSQWMPIHPSCRSNLGQSKDHFCQPCFFVCLGVKR